MATPVFRSTIARLLATSALTSCLWSGAVLAQPAPTTLPTGGGVTAGSSTIAQSGAAMTITQTSARSAINWQSYSIGANARVQYVQPNAQSVSLNRVVGNDPSQIYGQLQANGQVWLVNPNGILFGPGSRVDVAGLVAATANISDRAFMAGDSRLAFEEAGRADATIVNHGEITVREAGIAAFVAPAVHNHGTINARLGRVALGSATLHPRPVRRRADQHRGRRPGAGQRGGYR